jgi:hypothetical protein
MKEIVKLSLWQYFCSGLFCMCLIFSCYLLLTCFQILNFVRVVTVNVLMVVTVKITVFWDVMLFSLVEVYHKTGLFSIKFDYSLCHINRRKGKFAPALNPVS